MIILDNNKYFKLPTKDKPVILLSHNFLTIYGLPFCLVYSKNLINNHTNLHIALETKDETANSTLAIINNYTNLIISLKTKQELFNIKNSINSPTNLFTSLEDFKNSLS